LNDIRKRISTQAVLQNCARGVQKIVDSQLGSLLGEQYVIGKRLNLGMFAKKNSEQISVPKNENLINMLLHNSKFKNYAAEGAKRKNTKFCQQRRAAKSPGIENVFFLLLTIGPEHNFK
jgi:hypothetical protein